MNGAPNTACDLNPDEGNVIDGDDHLWYGDKETLNGGGGWRDMDATQGRDPSGKWARDNHDMEMQAGGSSASEGIPEAKQACTMEYIDLTAFSPPPETLQAASSANDTPQSSSLIEYGSTDEDEVSATENS